MATRNENEDSAQDPARRGEGISGNPEVDGFRLTPAQPEVQGPPQHPPAEPQQDSEHRLRPLGPAPGATRDAYVDVDGDLGANSITGGVRYGEGNVYVEGRETLHPNGRVDGIGVGTGVQFDNGVRMGVDASPGRPSLNVSIPLGGPRGSGYSDGQRDVHTPLVPPVGQLPTPPLTEPLRPYRPTEESFRGNPDLNRPDQPTGMAADVHAGRVPGLGPSSASAASVAVDPTLRAQAEAHIHRINDGLPENARLPVTETAQSLAGTAELRGLPRIGYVELGNPGADGERRLFLGAEARARERQPGAELISVGASDARRGLSVEATAALGEKREQESRTPAAPVADPQQQAIAPRSM
ncbi:hypothetical protein [Lysobacter sp. cf310]|uniref:hypothetical protein n=1 Tax=Lysobacter sp. cf310 TaxID=1761790 RepID=UPI0008EDEDF8|nr:hypothetical protein [Lysobacter sp. cf310]SFK50686.1 hypothetical protein SAMN04487938_1141 [Lysobacter sp. cf310]